MGLIPGGSGRVGFPGGWGGRDARGPQLAYYTVRFVVSCGWGFRGSGSWGSWPRAPVFAGLDLHVCFHTLTTARFVHTVFVVCIAER